ncbi:hypothetical protein PSAC2689_150023 [Paraburkholderia sacchari]
MGDFHQLGRNLRDGRAEREEPQAHLAHLAGRLVLRIPDRPVLRAGVAAVQRQYAGARADGDSLHAERPDDVAGPPVRHVQFHPRHVLRVCDVLRHAVRRLRPRCAQSVHGPACSDCDERARTGLCLGEGALFGARSHHAPLVEGLEAGSLKTAGLKMKHTKGRGSAPTVRGTSDKCKGEAP